MRCRPQCRSARLAVWLTLVVLAAACSDGSGDEPLEIVADLQGGQAWTATGGPVNDEVICGEGDRRPVGFSDPDGTPLALPEVAARFEAAAPGEGVDVLFLVEMTCADGSGTFTVAEHSSEQYWRVVDGRGEYADLTGQGSLTWEVDGQTPLWLYLSGTLERNEDS